MLKILGSFHFIFRQEHSYIVCRITHKVNKISAASAIYGRHRALDLTANDPANLVYGCVIARIRFRLTVFTLLALSTRKTIGTRSIC
ncbi:hypothetical protein PHMEG_0001288 [Phytophthora megakarya]|uniref:Uncharacterized protein n=1 Tax=Phytophthora megakarya TaxID=4795 RepID=A0A225X1J7_9STRA|nr:hypothetical protein PHMEG_0001288 [Phytophthora megakarya]